LAAPPLSDERGEIARLQKRNEELYYTIVDISKKLQPSTTNNTNTNTNSHNKTFNLNFFLNETCKDAMNLSAFIDSIQVSLGDLENLSADGFVKGISEVITANLAKLALTERPIHCSDLKRETLYVKDADAWEKEAAGNPRINRLVAHVSHKTFGALTEWREKHPGHGDAASRESAQYQSIVAAACESGAAQNAAIARRVAKQVPIGKP